jgi:hypothetical protein
MSTASRLETLFPEGRGVIVLKRRENVVFKVDIGCCLYPKGSKIVSKREHEPGETRAKVYGMK